MVGAWVRATKVNRSCRLCAKQPDLRKQWDCVPEVDHKTGRNKVVAVIYRNTPHETELDRCYARYIDGTAATVFMLFNHFRAGRMPFSGGVLDQPAVLLDAFNLIGGALAEIEEQG